jgi:hypothetical protein
MKSFKKEEEVVAVNEECPVVASERKNKKEICNYLALIPDFLFYAEEFTKEYIANMTQLEFELKYNLFKAIKKIDPDFPWDDPYYKDETEEEDCPELMYDILKECVEYEKTKANQQVLSQG